MIVRPSQQAKQWSARGRGTLVRVLALLALTLGLTPLTPSAAGASDTVTRWDTFSESSACNGAYTRPPFAAKTGSLSDSTPVLGPFGTYHGRSIAQIRSRLVYWTVPGGDGLRVQVHEAALPAFQEVSANLAEHAAEGRVYEVSVAGGFFPRTVAGSHQISRHSLGTTIDINPARNPYRSDGKLISDMPGWYVDAWRDAGFCWGGDWRSAKDPMHFSWMGPSTGFGGPLPALAPGTSKKPFAAVDGTHETVLSPVLDRYQLAIADGTGNGGPDVLGLRPHPDGAVVDIASGYEAFGSCSVRRRFLEDGSVLGADHTLFMDFDGDSRQDLVTISADDGSSTIKTSRHVSGFDEVSTFSHVATDVAAVAGADFDDDGRADLWVAGDDGSVDIYGGAEFGTVLHSGALPSGAPLHISAADRDGGDTPELFAVYEDDASASLEVLVLGSTWIVDQTLDLGTPAEAILAIAGVDYDGDGRADLMTLDDSGELTARVGNTTTGAGSMTAWFVDPDPDCGQEILLQFEGTFYDDEGSIHRNGIEWMAAKGITAGCNPPFNDAFCPESKLTRAQAATFVVRALGLPASPTDHFVDDDGHVLEGGINRVAEAGITVGCNPPANDRFCPNEEMTRAQFATFLARALGLPASDTDFFVDDDGHVLEGAINRLAASGITNGCNPPDYDRFCPGRGLTRAETATFLTRAFK